jgi:hypothetical protein
VERDSTPSSSLVPADSPLIHRLRTIFAEVAERAGNQGKMAWILKEIVDEVLEEVAGESEDALASYLLLTSRVMRWAATGEISDLPDEFKDHILQLEAPREAASEVEAMIAHK